MARVSAAVAAASNTPSSRAVRAVAERGQPLGQLAHRGNPSAPADLTASGGATDLDDALSRFGELAGPTSSLPA